MITQTCLRLIFNEIISNPDWLTGIAAILGVPWAIIVYSNQQRWKRTELILSEVKDFLKEPLVRDAMLMLDWQSRPIEIRLPGVPPQRFDFYQDLLEHALTAIRFPQTRNYTDEEVFIREAFDTMLGGLDRFGTFVDIGLIKKKHLAPYLGYWIDIIGNKHNSHKSLAARKRIWAYILDYNFSGVLKLLTLFGYDIEKTLRDQ